MKQKNEPKQKKGTLDRIVFQTNDKTNNNTGFIIGLFLDQHKNKFTALGNMINPQINLDYILIGDWSENQKFGKQFKFIAYETILPLDANAIFKYITVVCKWVGATVGNAIVDKYSDQTLIIMKTDPAKIAKEISGITLARAKEIQTTLLKNEIDEKLMVELGWLLDIPGMRKSLQAELIRTFKSNAAEIVKQNPYILTDFSGIGFSLADRVALNIGYARDSIERKKAVVIHCLKQNMQEGSVWITDNNLTRKIQELIQVPGLTDGIDVLISEGIIVEDNQQYAMSGPASDEQYITEVIIKMMIMSEVEK